MVTTIRRKLVFQNYTNFIFEMSGDQFYCYYLGNRIGIFITTTVDDFVSDWIYKRFLMSRQRLQDISENKRM
ncbi:unnamed protein product [Schistosoma bovis]|nr:unnamed protein product [Schistosoma bovis]